MDKVPQGIYNKFQLGSCKFHNCQSFTGKLQVRFLEAKFALSWYYTKEKKNVEYPRALNVLIKFQLLGKYHFTFCEKSLKKLNKYIYDCKRKYQELQKWVKNANKYKINYHWNLYINTKYSVSYINLVDACLSRKIISNKNYIFLIDLC